MASKPKKTEAAKSAVNLALLVAIGNAGFSPVGYMHVSDADAAPLLAEKLIVQNSTIANEVGQATKLTDAGTAYLNEHKDEIAKMTEQTQTAAPAAAPVAAPASAFQIVSDFELPAAKRTGPTRGESYPFGALQVGQAFFIPATADKPQPERSYASTVTSAKARYAVAVKGQTRVNRKGRTVPVVTQERDFAIRAVADGAAFGKPGVAGAVIKRIK